jgi:predicted CXXCH cytochrome family protein
MATWRSNLLPFAAAVLLCGLPARGQTPIASNTCVDCHSALDAPLQVTQNQYAQDIHAQKGLPCSACHGGDPTKADPEAMSKRAGFRGKIERKQIPALCGKCHSDGAYMRQYNPSLRTDQLAQYQTSIHGKRLAKGDTNVAVCTDCHGLHGIRAIKDTRSSVHPTNVAQTCARCHADAAHMKPYSIPTNQFAEYSASVHHEALAVRGDLSAPTCTTCHGNHGAAPPGVANVQNVCANCHVFQAQLFEGSPHKAAFAAAGLPGCVSCHSNHRVARPSDKMLGTGAAAVCTNCHTSGDAGYAVAGKLAENIGKLNAAADRSEEILDRAESSGMEVSQARSDQEQARDALTKARVSIHSSNANRVQQDIEAGMKTSQKTYAAGEQALKDRDYRRYGLGISVATILLVVIALGLYIRQIEGR